VAEDGMERRQRCQPIDYLLATDIPGVDYRLDAGKRRKKPRIKVAMSIGNDADEHASIIGTRNCIEGPRRKAGRPQDLDQISF
jgi:hypothetical protein